MKYLSNREVFLVSHYVHKLFSYVAVLQRLLTSGLFLTLFIISGEEQFKPQNVQYSSMKAIPLYSIVYFLFTVCILLHPVVFIVGTTLLLSALFISLLALVLMAESESKKKRSLHPLCLCVYKRQTVLYYE